MKIEVGEYVRTRAGHFYKITRINENGLIYWNKIQCGWNIEQLKDIVVKHSKNIIDLIEVKDVIEINTEKYEVIYDKSYGKLEILIPNKEQLAIRHCSLEYIFSKQRN